MFSSFLICRYVSSTGINTKLPDTYIQLTYLAATYSAVLSSQCGGFHFHYCPPGASLCFNFKLSLSDHTLISEEALKNYRKLVEIAYSCLQIDLFRDKLVINLS